MNAFKQLLGASGGNPPIGTWISSASPLVAEAVAHAGFDWSLIDMEHSPLDLMALVHLLQALAATRMAPLVRVPSNDAVTIKRVLDAGATTLMVPCIADADAARAAVASMRYPPEGVRAMSASGRASRFGTDAAYARNANRGLALIVQPETVQAIGRLESIAAVRGVDAIFLGPADLSASIGHVGQPTHPEVMDLMAQVVQRCKAIGKPVGAFGATAEVVAEYRAIGFDFVAIGSDLAHLIRGAKEAIVALKAQDRMHVHSLASGTRTGGDR
ncbi:MAG TPA: aldolase/citrate lyase family protein [Burkholderiaceae bacterium]|nr:2-dehydro-3-deoxyglucarate aldolase [Burkholderiaceae bacterium]HRP29447.1 aldolase/citrate lyase family protein [Burkholderiaceae bacterium]